MNSREVRKLISVDDIYEYCKPSKGGCWDWLGSLHNDGYAAWNTGGRQVKVHRASYLLHNGPVPRGRFVYHTCGNKACVNPDHLELVNHKQLYQRNRAAGHVARGERNGFSTLTAKDVRRIRRLAASGRHSHSAIGARVGCHQSNVTRIVNGTYWSHVE